MGPHFVGTIYSTAAVNGLKFKNLAERPIHRTMAGNGLIDIVRDHAVFVVCRIFYSLIIKSVEQTYISAFYYRYPLIVAHGVTVSKCAGRM